MSSNKTRNLHLNQCALDDKFKMEEFNADNSVIDTAIGALRESQVTEKLFSVVTTAPCAQIDLNVGGLDWSRYVKVSIFWYLTYNYVSSDNTNMTNACMRINNMCGAESYYVFGEYNQSPTLTDCLYKGQCYGEYLTNRFGIEFISEIFPQADGAFAVETEHHGMKPKTAYDGRACAMPLVNRVAVPQGSISSFNFFVVAGNSGSVAARTMPAGAKIFVYGVRK